MDETTTSTAQDETQAAEQPQPEAPETQAVQESVETESPNTQPDQPAEDEAELMEWAEKKGYRRMTRKSY